MRRLAAVATLVVLASAVGAVGAESIIKAVQNHNLPRGVVTVEEVETVVAVASAVNDDMVNASNKPTQDLAYAIH